MEEIVTVLEDARETLREERHTSHLIFLHQAILFLSSLVLTRSLGARIRFGYDLL